MLNNLSSRMDLMMLPLSRLDLMMLSGLRRMSSGRMVYFHGVQGPASLPKHLGYGQQL